jgi:hypothetical protein
VDCCITLAFQIVGNPPGQAGTADTANYVPASPRNFSVMGIPLRRLFNESDLSSSPPVALVSEALAKRYFPNQDPLGRHLIFGFPLTAWSRAKSSASLGTYMMCHSGRNRGL